MVETASIPVVILAGGEGSRLWPITDIYPKALVPIAGKPCIRWIIEELQEQGFQNITICINQGTDEHFRYELRDLRIEYSLMPISASICERILANESSLKKSPCFVVIYGDDLTRTNYVKLVTTLLSSDAAAVLATTHAAELEFGLIETTGNTVTRIIEKPTIGQITSHSIWSGRVAFKSAVLFGLRNSADLAKDVFPNLLAQGAKVIVQNENEPWYDVGSIGHWRKANEDYRKRRLSLAEFK